MQKIALIWRVLWFYAEQMINSLYCKWSNCSKIQQILNIHLLYHYYHEKKPFFGFFGRSGGFLDQNSSKLMDFLIFWYYWAHKISHCSIHFYDLLSYPSTNVSSTHPMSKPLSSSTRWENDRGAPLPRYPPEKNPKNPSWGPQNLTSRGYGHSKTRSGEFLLRQIL